MTKLAQSLKQDRKNWGLTIEDQAKRLDLSAGTISRLESGMDDISLKTIRQLAAGLKVSIQHIVSLLEG